MTVIGKSLRHDIYPARGRKLPDLWIITMVGAILRHDIYPARGRKLSLCIKFTGYSDRFATIFTPQGDGNWFVGMISQRSGTSPRYLPRKGTETHICNPVTPNSHPSFATIFTPQGDGNMIGSENRCFRKAPFATIFTPQGDGNDFHRVRWLFVRQSVRLRHDIYPARGRKHQ